MSDLKAVSGLPLAFTAAGSAGVGDQAGTAISDILTWLTQLGCKCTLPPSIPSAYHTLAVLTIVTLAMLLHLKLAKGQNQ